MENITKKEIGHLIAVHLSDAQMLQCELAKKIGVCDAAVSSWVNGVHDVPACMIVRICGAFGITPDEFFQVPGTKCNPVEVEKVVYKEAPVEKTEWLKDDRGIWFCKRCRMDAPYDSSGFQHRTRCCPYCGRDARPAKAVVLDGKEEVR